MFLSSLNNIKKTDIFAILLISFFPVLIFFGSGVINVQIILLDLLFLVELFRNKNFKYLNNKYFYSFILIWLVLLINLFFSSYPENSFSRSFGFFRFIIFVFALKYYIFDKNKYYKNYILSTWTVIFFIISIDLVYEFFIGNNLFGFESYMPGRLAGFFNQELKIGCLYSSLSLIIFTFIYLNLGNFKFKYFQNLKSKKYLIYLIMLFILSISFIIGERANFIKTFFMFFCFIFLFEKKFYKIKLYVVLAFLLVFSAAITLDKESKNIYKHRFWGTFLKPVINNPIKYLNNSSYGDHYAAAYNIYKDNKLFGVGLKNYREQAATGKYGNNTSTHPHEKHLELLAETGIIGYLAFLIFFLFMIIKSIKNYINYNNLYQLAGTLFVIANLIPLIPSGSLFTTFTATLFWMNFAFLIFYKNK